MEKNKKIILGLSIAILFIYIVFSLTYLYSGATDPAVCYAYGTDSCPHQEQLTILFGAIPIIVAIAIIVGAVVYYLMSEKVEIKEKDLKNNTEIILKFLNKDEKKLVNMLVESGGKVLQAELTRLPGMSKVKSHRTVQRLIDKGVIEKETLGKTNIVKFTKEVKDGLI